MDQIYYSFAHALNVVCYLFVDFGMTRDIYETDYYRKGGKGRDLIISVSFLIS